MRHQKLKDFRRSKPNVEDQKSPRSISDNIQHFNLVEVYSAIKIADTKTTPIINAYPHACVHTNHQIKSTK